ncbi:MAG: transglutaminase-like domain-containing protein [Pirellulaceae bacterium]|nr:transglutaminase domain-containing protein [Planctomycetales bacterium]
MLSFKRWNVSISMALLGLCALQPELALGQFGDEAVTTARLGPAKTARWRVGISVKAGGPVAGIFATFPVPTEWPEQQVRVVKEDFSPHISDVDSRVLDSGVKQMLVTIPQIPAGGTAEAILTFEVDRHPILAPEDTSIYERPEKRRLPKDVRPYLGASPLIEVRNSKITALARQLRDDELSAWEQVEKIYDDVRERVKYENGPIKGALAALRDGTGDCEELTSLFIALCRSLDIPARTVWVPDHCYPEFYLIDAQGNGHWFPCQAAGTRAFGSMPEERIILQKGDNFRVPEKRQPQRYVAEFLSAKNVHGTPPQVSTIRQVLLAE